MLLAEFGLLTIESFWRIWNITDIFVKIDDYDYVVAAAAAHCITAFAGLVVCWTLESSQDLENHWDIVIEFLLY